MIPDTEYKVVRYGKTVLVGSWIVCREEARANGGVVVKNEATE